jgi:hypothetical protein
VYAAARRVADNHGLPEDWLNDAVKGFLHGDDPDAVPVLDTPGLRVDVASARYLLADIAGTDAAGSLCHLDEARTAQSILGLPADARIAAR